MAVRHIPGQTAARIALLCLGRMACELMDPAADDHDHNACLRDDEAYAADLQLRLLAAVVTDDDDLILGRLEELRAALAEPA